MNEQGTDCLSAAPESERVDPSRASPGAGLGLAIAQEIARSSQGGRIEVSTQIGQGTRFTVTLPDSARPVSPRMHPAT
jgi:signal transduction histidine kinase